MNKWLSGYSNETPTKQYSFASVQHGIHLIGTCFSTSWQTLTAFKHITKSYYKCSRNQSLSCAIYASISAEVWLVHNGGILAVRHDPHANDNKYPSVRPINVLRARFPFVGRTESQGNIDTVIYTRDLSPSEVTRISLRRRAESWRYDRSTDTLTPPEAAPPFGTQRTYFWSISKV